MEIHISGEPQEISALVLRIQERQDQDIQIDGHSFLDAIAAAQQRASKIRPNVSKTQYSFLRIGDLANLIVTDDRETAKGYVGKGYTLLTVPQMFGAEDGVFTLALPVQNQTASPMSEADATRVLTNYETASREQYSS